MRREEREITAREELLAVLGRCNVLHLGLVDGDRPYVVPLNFGFEDTRDGLVLYFHSAREGRKIKLLRKNPHVCIQLECGTQVKQGAAACGWSMQYESLIGEATAILLEDEEEIRRGMDAIMRQCGYKGAPDYDAAVLARTQLIALRVETLTGKRNG